MGAVNSVIILPPRGLIFKSSKDYKKKGQTAIEREKCKKTNRKTVKYTKIHSDKQTYSWNRVEKKRQKERNHLQYRKAS